jgi:dipeptidase E
MGKIVGIGGVTPPSTLDLIDEEIIRLTKKKNPKVLYIPTAGGDNLDYCKLFKSIKERR